MRKYLLILFASLLLIPATALAERVSTGDGSLVVTDASGRLMLSGHGLIFGHLDKGTITIVGDYKPDDNTALSSVSGAKFRVAGRNIVYTGSNVRFLFPGGTYTLIVEGTGIDLSAVGTGKLSAVAAGLLDDGSVAVDGGRSFSLDLATAVSYGGKVSSSLNKGKTNS